MAQNNEQINFLATSPSNGGPLQPIHDCWVQLGDQIADRIKLYALPEIQDSKSVNYSDQTIQGRAAPVKTYANSSNRTINLVLHLYTTTNSDGIENLRTIRRIAALTHPEYNNTYLPPRIARIKCGRLLSEDASGVPVVLKNYDVNYDTNIQWFYISETIRDTGNNTRIAQTYMPLHVSINTSWDVVYSWNSLPGYQDVLAGKY